MEIKIQIDKCQECKHLDHTGAFTKGGEKPCCNHNQTCREKGYDCFKRVIPYKNVFIDNNILCLSREYHIVKKIPDWCPLKRGYKY